MSGPSGGDYGRAFLLVVLTCLAAEAAAVSPALEPRWPADMDTLRTNRERMEPAFRGTERPRRLVNSTHSDYILEFRSYFVRVTGNREAVGETLRVIRKPIALGTAITAAPTDLTIVEDAGWFYGVSGDYLFVDATTCPCPSGLMVYNLSTGRKIIDEIFMDDPEPALKSGRWLTYVEPIGDVDDPADLWPNPPCPEASRWLGHGLGVGYDEEVVVDLQTLRKVRSGKIRCGPRQ